jgi:hypothetical protein
MEATGAAAEQAHCHRGNERSAQKVFRLGLDTLHAQARLQSLRIVRLLDMEVCAFFRNFDRGEEG